MMSNIQNESTQESTHTQHEPEQPTLTNRLLEDLLDPTISTLDLCNYHSLSLPKLNEIIESEEFQIAKRTIESISKARQELIEPESKTLALVRMTELLKDKPTTDRECETSRKAASQILRSPRSVQRLITTPKPVLIDQKSTKQSNQDLQQTQFRGEWVKPFRLPCESVTDADSGGRDPDMNKNTLRQAAIIAAALAPLANAQVFTEDQTLDFPEGIAIPRSMTQVEQAYTNLNPIQAIQSRGGAPTGLIRTPGEYEPAEGIIMAWEGPSAWRTIQAQMTREITTTGNAKAFIFVDSASERNAASNQIANTGADMSRVHFEIKQTDTIWARDYGPRYIFLGSAPDGTGGVRAMVDHTYNRPRPNDNSLPSYWANQRNEPYFLLPLVHGGGNYHLETGNPEGIGHATRLINNENPGLTESQIIQHWKDYQNLDTTMYAPYPTFVDSTQHIDMWMIILDDNKVLVSEWVNEPNASWAITSDNAAADFAARGFEVFRVPAVRSGGTHYTYTNAVICNDLVLVPLYTNGTASQFNDDAVAVWEAAYPDKTIVQINCQALVTSAGVMHCIVKHVPAPANGDAPGLYMTSQNNASVINPNDTVETTWLFDSPDGVTTADLLLSTDGGATFPTTIATSFDGSAGTYYWTAPNVGTNDARLRLVIRDSDGNESFDDSDQSFTITGSTCIADLTGDGVLNFFDVSAFLNAFSALDPIADFTGDNEWNFFDVSAFLNAFNAGCP